MPAKVKFFTTKRNKKTTEDVNILIRFYQGRNFDINSKSQIQISPKNWNNESGRVRNIASFLESDEIQNRLDSLKKIIITEFIDCPDKSKINKEWLDTTIEKHYNPKKYYQPNTLFEFVQKFIDNSEKRINPNSGRPVSYKVRREYHVTFDYLKKYAELYKEPDFIDIDLEFYQLFTDMLRNTIVKDKSGNIIKTGLSINTIGRKIQTLKIFLNDATEKGVNTYLKYRSKNFRAITEEVDNIYLTKMELQKFYDYDFSESPSLERVRDTFIVACWTGLRFSDLHKLNMDEFDNGISQCITQNKTGNKVIIPIHPKVKIILEKHNGKLPKPISIQKYNEYLKQAAEVAGINEHFRKASTKNGIKVDKKYNKYELISSHTARRSFCTNAYLDNIPTLSIMAISGHKTEKAFLKYIKVEPEEHVRKVHEIWANKSEIIKIVS